VEKAAGYDFKSQKHEKTAYLKAVFLEKQVR